MTVLSLDERRARLTSGSGPMAERRRALFGSTPVASSDGSTAASLGASLGELFVRFGQELLKQTVQAQPAAPVPLAPPPEEPEPEPVAVAKPEGKLKGWILEAPDTFNGGKRRVRLTLQPDGVTYLVDTKDRYGNPLRSTLRAEFDGQSTLKAADD